MEKTVTLLTLAFGLLTTSLLAQSTTIDLSAALEVDSTTKGFLPPRMTTVQRDAIASPAEGLLIYNTSTQKINFYDGTAWLEITSVVTGGVVSTSGQTWMSKNLGASNIATASNDAGSYGHLYQWGRNSDGHEFRTSSTAAGPVASGSEGSNFITAPTPNDWLSTKDNTRWNGTIKGAHDPCPTGYRVPTETELETERQLFSSNNVAGAFASVLKLPAGGLRYSNTGALSTVGINGYYWSSTVSGDRARYIWITSSDTGWGQGIRAYGLSVRCLKD